MKSAHQPELMDALPQSSPEYRTQLAELIAEIDEKRLPVSSFHRGWILGSLSAKVALGYLITRIRNRFVGLDEQTRLKNEQHLKAALQLFGAMGYLRGAVMKIGQLLANLPEVTTEHFAEVLESLHFDAPPMHYAMVRDVFMDDFGQAPEQVFADFETQAFAAASLGQVHRARLYSGEEVAVKVQYPDIAQTIESDLRTLRLLLQPMRFSDEWLGIREKLDDLEQMLLMETDYHQEADFYRQARELFSANEQIIVPKIYDAYSSKRVLTTDYLEGVHLRELLKKQPSQSQRNHYCKLIVKATLRLYYQKNWFFTDAHPGNFIFMDGGQLGLIDFGSIRTVLPDEMLINNRFEQALIDNNREEMEKALTEACFTVSGQIPSQNLAILMDFGLWQMQPWLHQGIFDYGDKDNYRRGMQQLMALIESRFSSDRTLYLWSIRAVLGGRALAYQLKGQVRVQEILQQEKSLAKQLR